jgi:predicted dehydrogenase
MRALIAGAGIMGSWHARAIRRSRSEVIGVVDPDLDRASRLAAQAGAQPFESLDQALAALRPDVVHICTPLPSHVELIEAALAASCHVIAEKPLAPDAPATRALLERAAASRRLLIPVHQFAFQRGSLRLLASLPSLGSVVLVRAACATAGRDPGGNPDALVADILPHFLDLTRRILGRDLATQPWTVTRAAAGEWTAVGRCGEALVEFHLSTTARPPFNELQVHGHDGSARLDLFHGFCVFEAGEVSRFAKATRPFRVAARTARVAAGNLAVRSFRREPAFPGLLELVRRSYLAMSGAGESPVPPEIALDVAESRDRLRELAG